MPLPTLSPILDDDLPELCDFLHNNLNNNIPPSEWADAFRTRWIDEKPNNGFLIRDDDCRIVGSIGAIYSEQIIHGKPERFCNITSWCVLEEYRSQSMRLAMAIVSQKGYHFTDLTPTAIVARSLQFLKFKALDSDRTVIFNLPWPRFHRKGGIRIITDQNGIEENIPEDIAGIYRDHRGFAWLRYLAVRGPDGSCLIIFKPGRLKRVPSSDVLWLSDPSLFLRYYPVLGNHFLFRYGMATTSVESRFLVGIPPLSTQLIGYRQKMYRSEALQDSDITNLYSELICLNTHDP
jgi:hypothetical protein